LTLLISFSLSARRPRRGYLRKQFRNSHFLILEKLVAAPKVYVSFCGFWFGACSPTSGMEVLRPAQQIMEGALQLRAVQAEVLAGNVANADTPGYLVRDINFDQALQQLLDRGANQTSSGKTIALQNLRYDGNDVDLSHELAKAYENSLNYVATLKLYGDSVERAKTALSSS
jgi:flagellar basal-body rod protein FlgB